MNIFSDEKISRPRLTVLALPSANSDSVPAFDSLHKPSSWLIPSHDVHFVLLCSILELVRTHFATAGDEEAPRENSERRRSRADDNFKFFFGGIRFKNSQSEYLKI